MASLREARSEAGISQVELASRLGKPQQFVSLVEQGVRRIDVVEYCAIIQALGKDPEATLTALVRRFPKRLVI